MTEQPPELQSSLVSPVRGIGIDFSKLDAARRAGAETNAISHERALIVRYLRAYYLRVEGDKDRPDKHVIDIFMMSVKCGNCDTYQTVVGFKKYPEKNVYTYECENEICDPNVTRTIVEVPRDVDNSTKRAEELPYYEKESRDEEGPPDS